MDHESSPAPSTPPSAAVILPGTPSANGDPALMTPGVQTASTQASCLSLLQVAGTLAREVIRVAVRVIAIMLLVLAGLVLMAWLAVMPARGLVWAIATMIASAGTFVAVSAWCGVGITAFLAASRTAARHRFASQMLRSLLNESDSAGTALASRPADVQKDEVQFGLLRAALDQAMAGLIGKPTGLRARFTMWCTRLVAKRMLGVFFLLIQEDSQAAAMTLGQALNKVGDALDHRLVSEFRRSAAMFAVLWLLLTGAVIAAVMAASGWM